MYFNATASNRSLKVPEDESSGFCGDVPADSMHLIRSAVPGASDLPWTGVSSFQLFRIRLNTIKISFQFKIRSFLGSPLLQYGIGALIKSLYKELWLLSLWFMQRQDVFWPPT